MLCKIQNIDYSKTDEIWLVKFLMFNFKIVCLAQFSTDFNNLNFKIQVRVFLLGDLRENSFKIA